MLVGAFLLVILPILSFVGGSFLFSYLAYKGERFRKEMSASVNEALGVQGEFEDTFKVSKLTMKNRKFSAVGADNSVLAAFDLSNLEARLRASSYFSKEWRLPHLVADRAMLEFRPLPADASGEQAEAASPRLDEAIKVLAAGLGFSGVPDHYQIERMSCRHLSANFGVNLDVPHRLEGLHVSLNRTKSGYFINADRGTFDYFFWPQFHVDSADLTLYPDGRLTVHGVNLSTEEGGTASITGELMLGENPSVDLSAEVSQIKLDSMVNDETWGNRVLGLVTGEFVIKGDLTMGKLPVITGKIQVPDFSVKNLQILTSLSNHCGIAELKRLAFDLFEARIHQEGGKIRVYDIFGSRPSLAGLTGEFTVQPNHTIEGSFEIGLPESTLDNMATGKDGVNRGRPTFFKSKADGTNYGWAAFDVWGNLKTPIDNLDRPFEAYLSKSGSYNPREHRRTTTFQRPQPLHEGPQETYVGRLEGLFDLYMN